MKKLNSKIMILAAVMALAAPAIAKNAGGFDGPGKSVAPITIEQAIKMKDDTRVVLVGKIERALGDEKYMFTDSTGSIKVEIDDKDWRGINVTPQDTIKISGEVDKGLFKSTKIDVDYVELVMQ